MSLDGITNELMDTLKHILVNKITELIPNILREVTPDLINHTKTVIESYVIENSDYIRESLAQTDDVIKDFNKANERFIDQKLLEREQQYYNFARCQNLITLYHECLEHEPHYIPKKWRSDNYHVKSVTELNIVDKFDLERFKGECEILKVRRDEYAEKLSTIDTAITDLFTNSNLNREMKKKGLNRWTKLKNIDCARIDKKLASKTVSTKKAFEKDKVFLSSHRQNRVRPNTSSNPSSLHQASVATTVNRPQENNNVTPQTSSTTRQPTPVDPEPQSSSSGTVTSNSTPTSSPSTKMTCSSSTTVIACPVSTTTSITTATCNSNTSATSILECSPVLFSAPTTEHESPLYDPEHVDLSDIDTCSKNLIGPDSQDDPPIPPTAPNTQTLLKELNPRIKSLRSSTSQKQL